MVPTTLFKSVNIVQAMDIGQSVLTCINKPVNNTIQAGQLNHVQAGQLNHVQACQQAKKGCCAFLRVYV